MKDKSKYETVGKERKVAHVQALLGHCCRPVGYLCRSIRSGLSQNVIQVRSSSFVKRRRDAAIPPDAVVASRLISRIEIKYYEN